MVFNFAQYESNCFFLKTRIWRIRFSVSVILKKGESKVGIKETDQSGGHFWNQNVCVVYFVWGVQKWWRNEGRSDEHKKMDMKRGELVGRDDVSSVLTSFLPANWPEVMKKRRKISGWWIHTDFKISILIVSTFLFIYLPEFTWLGCVGIQSTEGAEIATFRGGGHPSPSSYQLRKRRDTLFGGRPRGGWTATGIWSEKLLSTALLGA